MKVLLISPLDPPNPGKENLKWLTGGENAFSLGLLNFGPSDVTYVHFHKALANGQIKWGRWYPLFRLLVMARILPLSAGVLDIELVDQFDVVHIHVFSARLTGGTSSVVVSDSSHNNETLRNYFGWSEWRIGVTTKIEDVVYKLFGIVGPNNAKNVIVFSRYAKRLHTNRAEVIYPGCEDVKKTRESTKNVRLIFVGTWFERKGGRLVVDVYRRLLKRFAKLALTVVGEVPADISLAGIDHFPWLPRKELMTKVFAKGDILVHVPKYEGFGLVVVEAMMWGMPVVVTEIGALPEIVVDGRSGYVISLGDEEKLEKVLVRLITDKRLRKKMGVNGRARYKKMFLPSVVNRQWMEKYKESVADGWR